MISRNLLSLVRCPDCRGSLFGQSENLLCSSCGRAFPSVSPDFLDLRPTQTFTDTTVYQDEVLHTDARYDITSAPVLSARLRQDLLRKFLKITPRDRLIDLGCGNGRSLLWNRGMGAWSVGVDVSPFFSSEVRQVTDLVVSDLRRLPLANASFTKAVSLDVLEHLSRDDLSLMLGETARVLSVGGQFFVYSQSTCSCGCPYTFPTEVVIPFDNNVGPELPCKGLNTPQPHPSKLTPAQRRP